MKKINIKGKDYIEVHERVMEFHRLHPNGRIETEVIEMTDRFITRTKVTPDVENPDRYFTGIAYEKENSNFITKTSALENCETSSWGRALSAYGLAGTEVASADEVAQAIHQQNNTTTKQSYPPVDIPADCISFGKHRGLPWKDIPRDYLEWLVKAENTKDDIRALAQDELDRGYSDQAAPNGETEDIPF